MIRYVRFAVNGSAGYDAMRAAGDVTLSLSAPNTCIEPAATAPLDTKGRILLAVNTSSIVYPAILPSLNALISSTLCEDISEADYWASFEQVVAAGGGGVSSWNDLTDKPSTFPPSAHTHGNIANNGSIGIAEGLILATGPDGVIVASAVGSGLVYEDDELHYDLPYIKTQLATVATTGAYADLFGKPVIPTTASGAAGGSLAGTYPNPTIAAGAVATASLADGAVTIAKTTGLQKSITSGTAAPSGGSSGDIYLRYS